MTELREALISLSERGTAQGATAVVDAADAEAGRHQLREGATISSRPQTWRRRVGRALVAAVAVSMLAASAIFVYVRHKLDEVTTVNLGGTLGQPVAPNAPLNILVVGSDRRSDVEGARADTIIVVRVDPVTRRVSMLSVPRDLWVPIAGVGASQRVNTALAHGADAMVRTVRDLLGIPINHFVEIDFAGFRHLVDILGGVDLAFDAPTRDVVSGLNITTAGCAQLDGRQALALVRSRHAEQLSGGTWHADPTGDLGRIRRQQQFLVQVAREVGSARNPLTLNRLLDAAIDDVRMDSGLDPTDVVRLARQLGSIDPSTITGATVPGTAADVDRSLVLIPDAAAMAAAVDVLLGAHDASTAPAPASATATANARPAC